MKSARILVTGGAGFIGSHTVDALLRENREVVVLDNLFSGRLNNLDLAHPNLEFVEGDVLEYPLLVDLLTGCDAVLHLAAIASVPLSIEKPIYSFQVNTQGFLHVLQAVYEAKRPIRLVYASSAAVYGEAAVLPCLDTKPLDGVVLSPYALQKRHIEQYADLYQRLHGTKSLGLRYFNVYGERQDPASPYSGVISRFLSLYQQDKALTIFGDGQQSRDFIHVQDVARANCLALQSDYAGQLNIATGQSETLLDLIQSIEAAGGRRANLTFAPASAGDIQSSYAATQLALQQIDFCYTIALGQGMRRMVS